MSSEIDAINRRTMNGRRAVAQYGRGDTLSAAEAAALARVADEAMGRPILDLGVGGGRTVAALRAVSNDYVGVDYSKAMVEATKRRYPGARFVHADARDLAFLADRSIFLAVFSCNGIGMVNHEDRLAILREVRRVLVPGGVFLFSTHNQRCPDHDAGFQLPALEPSANPAKLVVRIARFTRSAAARAYNRWRLDRHSRRGLEYSIINDVCHDYGVMLYYIGLEAQRRQLVAAGFEADAEAFDLEGRLITGDSTHSSITLLARARA